MLDALMTSDPAGEAERLVFPASSGQRRLWFLDQAEPGTGLYNVSKCLRVEGDLDADALAASFTEIVARHEVLRTTFELAAGEPVQVVHPAGPVAVAVDDLSARPADAREEEALRLVRDESFAPFDLAAGPLLRVRIIRLQPSEHLLLITMHHIVCDGWSMVVLFNELAELYNAARERRPPALADLPIQYGDYAAWEREQAQDPAMQQSLAYWTSKLAGAPALTLPADRLRPPRASWLGGSASSLLPRDCLERAKAFARRHNATLFMVALGVFAAVLHRYGGDEDIVIGAPIANRERPEVESLIGFFVNTIALRLNLAGDPSFADLLARARETALEAYRYQEVPFDKVVEALHPGRRGRAAPLFQVMLAVEHDSAPPAGLTGVSLTTVPASDGQAKFDLTLFLFERQDGLLVQLDYSSDLFDEATAARIVGHIEQTLEAAIADAKRPISRLPLVTASERALLERWNDTRVAYPRETAVHRLFEDQARRHADRTAIVEGGRRMSYAELDARAGTLARVLERHGVSRGMPVCLCLPRSIHLVAGVLAILKAGGVYVPLDPTYPPDRIASIVADTGANVVLSDARHRGVLPGDVRILEVDHAPATDILSSDSTDVGGADPAYIIYTSGSTGRPKGVVVPHRAIARLIVNTNYIDLSPDDRVAHVSNPAFDAATFEIWGALLSGATLVVLPTEVTLSPERFAAELGRTGITAMFLTTSVFNQIARTEPAAFRGLRYLLFGGEAADARAVAAVREAGGPAHLVNAYGPTETTTFAATFEVTGEVDTARPVPIGRPIANTTLFVLDRHRNAVPPGVAGELYIGGDGVALGYHGRPDLTAEQFIADPFSLDPAGRLYRTGDLVRFLADGNVEFLGRLDDQVKVRGFRVEPGEIESALQGAPGVAQAAVVTEKEAGGTVRLVAFVAGDGVTRLTAGDLRAFLKRRLPAFMVPSDIIVVGRLPLNANGKVDRAALKSASHSTERATRRVEQARDPLELMLVHLWEELLGVHPVGIHDDFFDLGGHSLLAARMIDELDRLTGRRVPLSILMQESTIVSLANALVQAGQPDDVQPPFVRLNAEGTKAPLFFLHGDLNGGGLYCANLARHLGADRPVLAVHPILVDPPRTIHAMADRHLATLLEVQPHGPYLLGGYCHGGLVAYEMARRLRAGGEDVPLVVLVDSGAFAPWRVVVDRALGRRAASWRGEARRAELFVMARALRRHLATASPRQYVRLLQSALRRLPVSVRRLTADGGGAPNACKLSSAAGTPAIPPRHDEDMYKLYLDAVNAYVPGPYDGRIALFATGDGPREARAWRRVADTVELHPVEGDHTTCVTAHVGALGATLARLVAEIDTTSATPSTPQADRAAARVCKSAGYPTPGDPSADPAPAPPTPQHA